MSPIISIFPYTTLFRSYAEDFGVLSCFIGEFSHPDFKQTLLFVLLHEIRNSQRNRPQQHRKNEAAGDADMRTEIECDRRDRKSTRLNSSHVAISYAVFC